MMPILIVDDDPDDSSMTQKALEKNQVPNPLVFLKNGEEVMDYLAKLGTYVNGPGSKWPALILLDLNMPKMDGRTALELIKTSDQYKSIPVVVLSTSCDVDEVSRIYGLGANSYICKPTNFENLVKMMGLLKSYWIGTVKLPYVGNEVF